MKLRGFELIIHIRHWRSILFFRFFSNGTLGGQYHSRNGSRVLQRTSGNLNRINNSGFEHIHIFLFYYIEADPFSTVFNLFGYHGTVQSCIYNNLPQRFLQCLLYYRRSGFFIASVNHKLFKFTENIDVGSTASGYYSFLNGSPCSVKRVFDP